MKKVILILAIIVFLIICAFNYQWIYYRFYPFDRITGEYEISVNDQNINTAEEYYEYEFGEKIRLKNDTENFKIKGGVYGNCKIGFVLNDETLYQLTGDEKFREYGDIDLSINYFNKNLLNISEIDIEINIIEEKQILELEAGCSLQMIANTFSKKGYSGLEFACGIPGSIGGAIFMNAGAYLKSMSDIVIDVTLIDENNEIKVLSNEEMKFSYRKSIFSENKYICLKTRLQLKKAEKEEIINLTKDRLHRRLQTQPLQYPSAGSVFRNPDGDYAGRLIEECQLKGMVYGGAEISEKHANFIVNKNEAKSSDIKYLILLNRKDKGEILLLRFFGLFIL